MAPITTANFGELIYPGLKAVFDDAFSQIPSVYPKIYNVVDSDKASESYVDTSGLSLIPQVTEGNATPAEDVVQGYKTTLVNATYRGQVKVSQEMIEDDLYNVIKDQTKNLGTAAWRTQDYESFKDFRRGFDTAWTSYGDVKPFFSTAHTSFAGGSNQSNASSTGITLNEANLETGMVALRQQQDPKDNPVVIGAGKLMLMVPFALEKEAVIITQSAQRATTADNDMNFYEGRFTVVVNPWIGANVDTGGSSVGSDTAWFILDPVTHRLKFQWRVKQAFEKDVDVDKTISKFHVRFRFAHGWCGWVGTWGSKGDTLAYSS